MSNQRKKTDSPPAKTTVEIHQNDGESKGLALARSLNNPVMQAAVTLHHVHGKGVLENSPEPASFADQRDALQARTERVLSGDMRLVESTLVAQTQTLDALFNLMAQRAMNNVGHSLEVTERYMRMALKAQSQCRATLETLAEIKAPRVAVFANQANVANGPQQVNNGVTHAHGTTERQANKTNELLEQQHGERLDIRAQGTASGANPAMAPMGKKHRAED